jgi:hypothetical protein
MPRGKPGLGFGGFYFLFFGNFYFLVAHDIFLAGIGVGGAGKGMTYGVHADCIFYVYLGSCTIYCICFSS